MKKSFALSALALSLSLASCGGDPAPDPVSRPAIEKINGQVTQGSGTGTITLNGSQGVLSQGTINADGSFTLDLPDVEKFRADLRTADQALATIGCTGTLNSSVPTAKGYTAAVLNAKRPGLSDNVYSATLDVQYLPPKGVLRGNLWLYTDQATTLTGNLNCSKLVNNAAQITLALNVKARAGWNQVAFYAEGLTSLNGNANEVAPSKTVWQTADQLRSQIPFQ